MVALFAILVICGTLLLSSVELRGEAHVETPGRSVGLLFETVSALGTVGLTTGITSTDKIERAGFFGIVVWYTPDCQDAPCFIIAAIIDARSRNCR